MFELARIEATLVSSVPSRSCVAHAFGALRSPCTVRTLAHTNRMLRLLAAIAIVSAPLVLAADSAHACSCVPRPYAEHAKAAKRVVLARAGKPIKTGDALKQTFTVLATFKGPAQPTFLLDRRATPP